MSHFIAGVFVTLIVLGLACYQFPAFFTSLIPKDRSNQTPTTGGGSSTPTAKN